MELPRFLQTYYVRGLDTHPVRERIKGAITTALLPIERQRARKLESHAEDVMLHIGSGDTYLENWINIDLARPGRRLDLRWDLRRGLPFSDGSVSAIFSEHFFEHLDLAASFRMVQECRRVLEPGGICRIVVPDLERYIQSYIGNDSMIQDMRPESPTRMMALNEVIYFHGHKSMYDSETFVAMLVEAGFSRAEKKKYGVSAISPCPDSTNRESESLYVEAKA